MAHSPFRRRIPASLLKLFTIPRVILLTLVILGTLAFLALLLILHAHYGAAEQVDITIKGEDERDFFHPCELLSIEVGNLDELTSCDVHGPANITLDHWIGEGGRFTHEFPAPSIEGNYRVEVTGLQSGKERTGTISFNVESFDLRMFPDENHLISDQEHPAATEIHIELVDWKGDPIQGRLLINVSRLSLINDTSGDPGEAVADISISIDGFGSIPFFFPPVLETTLFNFQASFDNFSLSGDGLPGSTAAIPGSECGVVVDPFSLELEGDRTVLEGGGSSINGPFLKRDAVEISIRTPGAIENVTLTDVIENTFSPFDRSGSEILFIPDHASIFQLQVSAELNGARSTVLMIIPVSDWPISVSTPVSSLMGEPLTIEVHRDNGDFFGVRTFLFDLHSIPIFTIMELIDQGGSSSPFFEKGLLDSQGNADLTFILPTNLREGSYTLITGLGSWEGEISYHGIAFSTIEFTRPVIEAPAEGRIREAITVKVSDPGVSGSINLDGTINCEGNSFSVVNGTANITFVTTGSKNCFFSRTGRDVTHFTIMIHNHSLVVSSPGYALRDQEFTLAFFNESRATVHGYEVAFSIMYNGSFAENGTLPPDSSSGSFRFPDIGIHEITLSAENHAPATVVVHVIGAVFLNIPDVVSAGSQFLLEVVDSSGNPLGQLGPESEGVQPEGEGVRLEIDGVMMNPDNGSCFSLTLSRGTHRIKVLSGELIIHEQTIDVHPRENDMTLRSGTIPLAAALLSLFLLWIIGRRGERYFAVSKTPVSESFRRKTQ